MSRFKENEQALIPLGATIRNYDYLDLQYREKAKDGRANLQAAEQIKNDIIRDIEAIISENQNRELFIYGPATFGKKITHPDHQILHDAFIQIAKKYSGGTKINFIIYEDFSYVRQFAKKDGELLKNYLSAKDNLQLEENFIELNYAQISQKISAISKYSSQIRTFKSMGADIADLAYKFTGERCKTLNPNWSGCEAVYKVGN